MIRKSAKKPNFILIYCDDLGYGDLGCYGSAEAQTPHLDQLAAEGIRFTDWYSNSPVCSASRASLLTGKYPQTVGVNGVIKSKRGTKGLDVRTPTLANVFQSMGYRTALFGKWHLGSSSDCVPNARGFGEFYGFHSGCVDFYSHIYYWGQAKGIHPAHDLWHNAQEVWNNGKYMTELITEKAADYIGQPSDQPFFAYVAYNAPHYPMHAPQPYMDRFAHLPWEKQVMHAMISAIDDGVGEIVRVLKQTGQYDNTVIFFSSDNGPSTEARNWLDGTDDKYYGGSAGRFRGHKFSLFEGGIREPAILFCPGWAQGGQVIEEVGMMMDVFPTFVEMAGGTCPADVHGSSIVPMIAANDSSPHEYAFWDYDEQLAVRHGQWKLVINGRVDSDRNHRVAGVHLADLSADSGERQNLADRCPERTEQLMARLQQWQRQLYGGDPVN